MYRLTRQSSVVLVASICVLNFALLVSGLTFGHNWEDDFALYLMQTIGLATNNLPKYLVGNAFTVLNSSFPFGPLAYPWGLPLLLLPVYLIYELNFLALKLPGVISQTILIVVLFLGLRERHSTIWLTIALGIFAFNYWLFIAADSILSDIPFLLISTYSVFLINRVVANGQSLSGTAFDRLLTGALVFLCFLLRTNGFILILLIIIADFIRIKKYYPVTQLTAKDLTNIILPYGTFAALFILADIILPDGSNSHLQHLQISSKTIIINNIIYNLSVLSEFFGSKAIYFISSLFFFIGVFVFWQSRIVELSFILLTFGVYTIWPYNQGVRFFLPILPFYISFMISGVELCLYEIQRFKIYKIVNYSAIILAILFICVNIGLSTKAIYKNAVNHRTPTDGIGSHTATELFDFIKNNGETERTIIFRKPRAMHLMTGRQSVMLTSIDKVNQFLPALLIIDKKNTDYQLTLDDINVIHHSHTVKPVYTNDQFTVYTIEQKIK